jgi:NADH:ubiquinone oxidoreductase subunit 3 (subunit A)
MSITWIAINVVLLGVLIGAILVRQKSIAVRRKKLQSGEIAAETRQQRRNRLIIAAILFVVAILGALTYLHFRVG